MVRDRQSATESSDSSRKRFRKSTLISPRARTVAAGIEHLINKHDCAFGHIYWNVVLLTTEARDQRLKDRPDTGVQIQLDSSGAGPFELLDLSAILSAKWERARRRTRPK